MRQLRYSNRHGNTLDVTLALNGIPVATAEIKNPMTGQTWREVVRQYKRDRDPADLIFQFRRRALVHFAVDPDEVYMTTRPAGRNTHYLPFNKGCAGGAGNPENPGGWKTAGLRARQCEGQQRVPGPRENRVKKLGSFCPRFVREIRSSS